MHVLKFFRSLPILFVPFFLLCGEERFESEIYWKGSDQKDPVFIYKNAADTVDGRRVLGHYYYKPDGPLFASEELFLGEDGQWQKHVIDFPVLEERSVMLNKGDEVELRFHKEGNTKSRTRELQEPLLFGPVQQEFVRKNLQALKSGEKIYFYLPAAEFGLLVQFKMEKTDDTPYGSPGAFVVMMSTKSFILSWFLGDSYFVLDKEDATILEIHGSSVLKQQVDGKWEYIDVDIDMEYTEPEKDSRSSAAGAE